MRLPCRTGSEIAIPNSDLQLIHRNIFLPLFRELIRKLKVSFKVRAEEGLPGPCAVGNGARTPTDGLSESWKALLGFGRPNLKQSTKTKKVRSNYFWELITKLSRL